MDMQHTDDCKRSSNIARRWNTYTPGCPRCESLHADLRARQYIRRIRNGNKRAYAIALWDHLTVPGVAAPDRNELSSMAAQAVGTTLRAFKEWVDEPAT